jgi:hypothetical protein
MYLHTAQPRNVHIVIFWVLVELTCLQRQDRIEPFYSHLSYDAM